MLWDVDPERVIVPKACCISVGRSLSTLASRSDVMLTEELTTRAEALDEACRKLKPKVLCCVPTIQNPTTATIPPTRRRAVVEAAQPHSLSMLLLRKPMQQGAEKPALA